MTEQRHSYLAVYDYGQGGVWALITASSETEIATKYPFITVVELRPAWMTDEIYNHLESFDIDDAPTGWVAKALEEMK